MIFKESFLNESVDTDTKIDFDKRLEPSAETDRMLSTEYDFDKRIDYAIEDEEVDNIDVISLEECIDMFDNEVFKTLTLEEKTFFIDMMAEYICDDLEIKDRPLIIYIDADKQTFGGYKSGNNIIELNENYLDNGEETLNTLLHEYRHCWQNERAQLPEELQSGWDKVIKDNLENYISPEFDSELYFKQPVEVDARYYVEQFITAHGIT